jgi:hypothetical protein
MYGVAQGKLTELIDDTGDRQLPVLKLKLQLKLKLLRRHDTQYKAEGSTHCPFNARTRVARKLRSKQTH